MSREAKTLGKNNSHPNPSGTKILKGFFRAKFQRKPLLIKGLDVNLETGCLYLLMNLKNGD